ncbi:kinase-like domain-containing protein [Zychaea mexicana]|uniref:kinase-like domain-containing protein n=1 Tax=Zychaea mexicana TaxID=64656 RepID=UPI0022FE3E43|nr:kinase-like domain-containing protein [Zychaea mexicana]KAI9494062.1 kinase-like domain-containing protein [Zychaea mexicana]
MRRHFEKPGDSTVPTTSISIEQSHQRPQQRSRRRTWSGVLGWRYKNNKSSSNKDTKSTTASVATVTTPATTATRHVPPPLPPRYQQQQQRRQQLHETLSPPTSPCSVATTISVLDSHSLSSSPSSSLSSPYQPIPSAFHRHPFETYHIDPVVASGKVKPIIATTILLRTTYLRRNPNFRYDSSRNPRRVLTKPSVGCKNDRYDNENSDLILYVNAVLGRQDKHHGNTYVVQEMLGSGTFGQVVKCVDTSTHKMVGVKVIKNKPAYLKQSMVEVEILKHLNNEWDPKGDHHILRLLDVFKHRHHLCIVFELLSVNLYELIKQNKFRGLSINLVRVLSAQIIDVLIILKEAAIIHCDLKPENILLRNLDSPGIKVIDFGSACHQSNKPYTYIQSRFYRSPEVLLGINYTSAIDMWSFGCIVAELFLGLPLFPGSSEYNQLSRIIDSLGLPPVYMTEQGRNSKRYFNRVEKDGRISYTFKSRHQYMDDENKNEKVGKKYFSTTHLDDLILTYPMPRKHMSEKDKAKEMQKRLCLVDFLKQVLQIDPLRRLTPQEAKHHPFITGEYNATNSSTDNATASATAAARSTANSRRTSSSSTVSGKIDSSHDAPTTITAITRQVEQEEVERERQKDAMSNCCICSVSASAQIREQHEAHQREERQNKKQAALFPNGSMMDNTTTPPLSPIEMNVKEASVSGISTATNIPQSNRSSRRSSAVGLVLNDQEQEHNGDATGLRLRQSSMQ